MITGKEYATGANLRARLAKYGIGVDCSAFVQHALIRIMQSCYAPVGQMPDRRDDYGLGFVRSKKVCEDVRTDAENDGLFDEIRTPNLVRPGDVLVKQGHVRIVASTKVPEDGSVVFKLAESSLGKDSLPGNELCEADIGPRLYQVAYSHPDSPIRDQVPLRKRLCDREFGESPEEQLYLLGRFRPLARIQERCLPRRQHPKPE